VEAPYSKGLEFTLAYFLNGVKMGFLVPCFGCRVAAIMTFVPQK